VPVCSTWHCKTRRPICQSAHSPRQHTLFTILDRINKAPNYLLAWASGLGESYRERIRPIDEPLRESPLLKPHYYAMIAICRI
jgi:hypothetical protein